MLKAHYKSSKLTKRFWVLPEGIFASRSCNSSTPKLKVSTRHRATNFWSLGDFTYIQLVNSDF